MCVCVCACVWSRIEPLAYAEAYFCVSVWIFCVYVCVCMCGLETKSECASVGIFEKGWGVVGRITISFPLPQYGNI